MFAIPGIGALILWVLARPQELEEGLKKIPFLYVFALLAIVGYVIDLRLRRVQPIAATTLPWVVAFLIWAILCAGIMTPALLIQRLIELLILFILYFTIAHGIQTFRAFQKAAGVLALTSLFITGVCFDQGLSDKQCIVDDDGGADSNGTPDGRACEVVLTCREVDAEPGADYRCDPVGVFGITAIEGRVRYTGELHDPNEVSLAICAGGLAILFGFAIRRGRGLGRLVIGGAVFIIAWTVVMTGSRGGLVMMMMVPGVYAVRKWGLRAIVPAVLVAIPVMSLSGRSGEEAETSTQMRYEAWAKGLELFHHNPIFGVGPRQFGEYHYITAHNSYVLTLAELGYIGCVLFVALLYLSVKTLVIGLREVDNLPDAKVARTWGMSLLAAMCGILFQIGTLSFAYHSVLWIFFGMVGAWGSALRAHRPGFTVKLTLRDLVIIGSAVAVYAFVVLPIFLRLKGEM